ncbi:hypothetical protein EHQ68_16670 [Leptospira congkakensis]|uniref:Metallo-beta-lactamase domain-containing protein n=1 Tax=Leptospira congkakensis TaxID=2484932 RepID=A0A8B5NC69_9LEPT|nr:MBL fold metallo-hydrolase [Leptospira congkakensis]TGL85792.1 hypothetical protein EHQ68_16670 [Leptospira congkakensis]TGL87015.1 hypothetical protein EHQ69_17840 [Leptospira congkakensis]
MIFKIFDVEHGFFMFMETDNGKHILIECGHNSSTGFNPTDYLLNLGVSSIEELWISNFDEDHISNLNKLQRNFHIDSIWKNPTLTANDLKKIKEETGPLTSNMETMVSMINEYNFPKSIVSDYAGLTKKMYYNSYPEFTDTNNLSAVFFFSYKDLSFVYAGDMEKKGWEKLLERVDFQKDLQNVNIFIASHHGRESGYTPSIFDYCNPQIIIISDKEIIYETQEHDYTNHAKGIQFKGKNRYVFTTRKDGRIKLEQTPFSDPVIDTFF